MNTRYVCTKCHSWNDANKGRCGFCGEPSPIPETSIQEDSNIDTNTFKLLKDIHQAVEKLTPGQLRKVWRYLEDNML